MRATRRRLSWHFPSACGPLLGTRHHSPRRRRAAEQRDERAPFHCPMPPVLRTESIAHLGTADCCIHPPGNDMIAITPPKIFSKEVAQKQATPFARQQAPSSPEIVLRQISGDEAWMKI